MLCEPIPNIGEHLAFLAFLFYLLYIPMELAYELRLDKSHIFRAQVVDLVKQCPSYQACIIAMEGGTELKQHFHAYIIVDKEIEKSMINNYRKLVKEKMKVETSSYSFVKVKKTFNCFRYTLKDGNFIYDNISKDEIEIRFKSSYKTGTKKFQEELDELEIKYYRDQLSREDLRNKIIELKLRYNQTPDFFQIDRLVNKFTLKKTPDLIPFVPKTPAYTYVEDAITFYEMNKISKGSSIKSVRKIKY